MEQPARRADRAGPIAVDPRTLAAEAAAAAGLALVQSPALWDALTALGTLLDALSLGDWPTDVTSAAVSTADDAELAAEMLAALDQSARRWATIAHAPGVARLLVLGTVS